MAISLPIISPRIEVTLRIVLVTMITSIFSLASLPKIIPPGLSQLIGIFGPSFALSLPHVAFIVGATLPSTILVIILGLLGGTALLATATVSDGLYVGVFAIWALYCTSLNYGPDASKTASNSGLLIVAAGMVSLGSWQLVQHGLSITLDFPIGLATSDEFLSDALQALAEKICGEDIDNCTDKIDALAPPGASFIIPGDSNFSGQTATVYCVDSVCTVTIPGGLWLVTGFWTWSGLTNPLAVFRNFLIAMCWALLCVSVGILFFPIRTVRKMYARGMLPASITDAISYIKINDRDDIAAELKEEDTKEEKTTSVSDENQNKKALREKIIRAAVEYSNGGKAPLTAYEPRLCSHPLECTWPALKALTVSVNKLGFYALGSELRQHFSERETEKDIQSFSESIQSLEACSLALAKDESVIQDSINDNAVTKVDEEEGDVAEKLTYLARGITKIKIELSNNVTAWYDAMHKAKCTEGKDCIKTYVLWLLPIVLLLKAMFFNLLIPFQPKRWNLRAFFMGCKFAVGCTMLVICEVYWAEYRGFAVGESQETGQPNGPITVALDQPPNFYSGWNLIGFILATTPTVEGTVKKGFFRALGTASGGFLAWLAIIVCSGSYDQNAEVNLYGLVAWLTITTGAVAYFSIQDGPAAFLGLNPDNGMYGMYVAMTQALCALEIALAIGERDVIVTNRIIATLTGVLMAMIVALIPPHDKGSDVAPIIKLLRSTEDTFVAGIRLVQNNGGNKEDIKAKLHALREALIDQNHTEKANVEFLIKDASKLNGAPIFKVDPRLSVALNNLTVIDAYVTSWLDFAAHTVECDELKLDDEPFEFFRGELETVVNIIENFTSSGEDTDKVEKPRDIPDLKQVDPNKEEPDLLLHVARFICARLEDQETLLAEMK